MIPYKFLITGLPRSQTYWLSKFFGFDHDKTADAGTEKWQERGSEGLCDTGIYMLPDDMRAELIDAKTTVIIITRPVRDVTLSLVAKGCSHKPAWDMMSDASHCLWNKFLPSLNPKPFVLPFPIDVGRLHQIQFILGISPGHSATEAVKVKHDLMDNPAYIAKMKEITPHLFQ